MCGIFGIQSVDVGNISRNFINKISFLMNKRGPDATGFYLYNSLFGSAVLSKTIDEDAQFSTFFMHKRLSILDLSDAGNQPMMSSDGRFVLVFNGEIYNFKELRIRLESIGIKFYTNCDTEVLLQYLINIGTNNLQELEGMFAFAFFDKLENKLILARDPFGIKPLYFFKTKNIFAFSSQINCLMEVSDFGKRTLNMDKYLSFLRLGMTDFDDNTLVKNVFRINPGHCITITINNGQILCEDRAYFRFSSDKISINSFEEDAKILRNKLEESVQKHLVSDVPVCFNLSGGLDSSALVGLSSKFHKDITAFTYAADEKNLDESHYAECVAKHCNVRLIKIKIDPNDFGTDLDNIIYAQCEPYAGSSIYAQRKLYEAQAKLGFKVCIDGQGGDELFAGYANYFAFALLDALKNQQYGLFFEFIKNFKNLKFNTARVFSYIGYAIDNTLINMPKLRAIFRKITGRGLCPFYLDKTFFNNHIGQLRQHKYGSLREALEHSLFSSSIPTLVRYADRNAMSFSIENRVPFLTNQIAQFAHTLPNNYLISKNGWQKYILRESVKDVLPEKITYRKDKMGFPPTEGLWLLHNKDIISKILTSDTINNLPGVIAKEAISYWNNVCTKGQTKGWRTDIIWKLVNMIRWIELNNIVVE